jgi:hypothetical protein
MPTAQLRDSNDVVRPTKADLLIEDTKIVGIGEGIDAKVSQSALVIDCTDKIVSPGFVHTHHHVWQTCLKGNHGDETLIDYFSSGECAACAVRKYYEYQKLIVSRIFPQLDVVCRRCILEPVSWRDGVCGQRNHHRGRPRQHQPLTKTLYVNR